MYQLLILIPSTVNTDALDEGWPAFLDAAESMDGLIRESVSRVDRNIFGQNNILRIYSFLFHDKTSFNQALMSSEGEKAGEIIHQITGGEVILLGGTFHEDSLDHIQSWEDIEEGS